jgi:hypothetical protein
LDNTGLGTRPRLATRWGDKSDEDHDRDRRRLAQAGKQLAVERNVSVKAALHQFVGRAQAQQQQTPFKLRKCPIYGRGLQPGLEWHDWEKIRTLIYEGRGG